MCGRLHGVGFIQDSLGFEASEHKPLHFGCVVFVMAAFLSLSGPLISRRQLSILRMWPARDFIPLGFNKAPVETLNPKP